MSGEEKKSGRGKTITHGLYQLSGLPVSEWPKDLQELYQERYRELCSHRHIDPELHKGAVAQLVQTELIVNRCMAWLNVHGLFTKGGKVQPVLNVLLGWSNTLHRLYQTMGLCPLTSRKFKRQEKTLADYFSEVDEAEEVNSDDQEETEDETTGGEG